MLNSILELQDVTLSFEKTILHHINYQIDEEDFIVFLGSNGSGKSSLLKILNQQYQPQTGRVLFKGKDLREYSSREINQQIKMVTQNTQDALFPGLTILENFLVYQQQNKPQLFKINKRAEREMLREYLLPFNENLVARLDQPVEKLSGGEKQALVLALVMYYPPSILLLDEHTAALDPNAQHNIMRLTHELVKKHKLTCIFTTHDLRQAENYGNRILSLKNGVVHKAIEAEAKVDLKHSDLLVACY